MLARGYLEQLPGELVALQLQPDARQPVDGMQPEGGDT